MNAPQQLQMDVLKLWERYNKWIATRRDERDAEEDRLLRIARTISIAVEYGSGLDSRMLCFAWWAHVAQRLNMQLPCQGTGWKGDRWTIKLLKTQYPDTIEC